MVGAPAFLTLPRETHQLLLQGPHGPPQQVYLPRPKELGGEKPQGQWAESQGPEASPRRPSEVRGRCWGSVVCPWCVHNLLFFWCLGSRVMCRCGPGQVSACVSVSASSCIPSLCLLSVSLFWSYCADGRPTPVRLTQPTPEQWGQGGLPTLSPRGALPWTRSWAPAGATVGPWVVVFTLNFLYLSDLGFLMTVKMKLVRRCELTASCGRQTDYLPTQPM